LKELFKEFPPVSVSDWEKLIEKDLKGQDYEKKLIWKTEEGFSLRPYYTEESIQSLPNLTPPGLPSDTQIIESITSSSQEEALDQFRKAIASGAQGVRISSLWSGSRVSGLPLSSESEIGSFSDSLFRELLSFSDSHPQFAASMEERGFSFFWETGSTTPVYLKSILDSTKKVSLPEKFQKNIHLFFAQDPLGAVTVCGEFPNTTEKTWQYAKDSIQYSESSSFGSIRTLAITPKHFANSGSNLTTEAGFGLAIGSEYLAQGIRLGLDPNSIANSLYFRFSVGSNYFHEIAKFRAFRSLWNKVLESYSIPEKERTCWIDSETSLWYTNQFDPHVNMIRVTTESMSAILGGANSLNVQPFDSAIKDSDEFSRRIARNVPLLLTEESYLDKVIDPSSGSYYMDHLTFTFAESIWKIFQDVESKGGYLQAFRDGYIQDQIEAQFSAKQKAIRNKQIPVLGVSQYPNWDETPPEIRLAKPQEFSKSPFPEFQAPSDWKVDRYLKTGRAGEEFEALRRKVWEASRSRGKRPLVALLLAGNPSLRTARAGFASNFFGVAGFEIWNPGVFASPEEALGEIAKKSPDISVICSSDEEYFGIVSSLSPIWTKSLPKTKFYLAGNPETPEGKSSWKELGIQDKIHMKSPLYPTLEGIVREIFHS
jgi:methylmalonyl-CoA mutase